MPNSLVALTGTRLYAVEWQDNSSTKKLRGLSPQSELYRPSDRSSSAKLVQTFVDTGCHMVNVTNPYGRVLGFLDRRGYYFFQVAPQLYSRD
jgi:hypothetical protein